MGRIGLAEDAVFLNHRSFGIRKKHIFDVFCLSEIPLFRTGFGVYRNYLRAGLFKVAVSLAQTEELPGADSSMKRPEENQHGLLFTYQAAEPGYLAVAVR